VLVWKLACVCLWGRVEGREGRAESRGAGRAYDWGVVVHLAEEVAEAGVFFAGDAGVGCVGCGVGVGGG